MSRPGQRKPKVTQPYQRWMPFHHGAILTARVRRSEAQLILGFIALVFAACLLALFC